MREERREKREERRAQREARREKREEITKKAARDSQMWLFEQQQLTDNRVCERPWAGGTAEKKKKRAEKREKRKERREKMAAS